ncbi:MAG: glycosyltransferase family 4 protein [Bacteroidaceae bacterium]|nr:glycosyltransferase family 4 protein [Bacteroidaceae bacterium]
MVKKKIAFVVAIPLTATAFLMDHIAALQRSYEVHLICNFPDEESKKNFEVKGITCHTAPILRNIDLIGDLKGLFALRKIFRKERFDCVHSVTPKAGLLTACAGWLARVPNRVHIFTGQVWATRKGAMRFMLKMMDKLIALFDTRILVDGEGQRQFLIKNSVLTEKNSSVPANGSIAGIKLERYVISEQVRRAERDNLGIPEDHVVYIFLGRLNHDKGIGELYEAFNRLVVDCPKAVLLFYGMDEEGYDEKVIDFPNIKKGENFFFPGLTKTPFNALQAGDVFVLPTWREGFGVSVLEAQALGLPVITSDAYGVVDASIPEVTGLRCGVNDPEGLYRCMKQYYDHPEMRKEHGKNGRKRVEEDFSNDLVSAAWLDFYKEMLGE